MNNKFKELGQKIREVIVQYPMIITMSLITAFALVSFIAISEDYSENAAYLCGKLAMVCGLGISLLFAINMICQRHGKEFIGHILALAILLGVFFFLPNELDSFTTVHVYVFLTLLLSSHLLVAFGPFINYDSQSEFWQYNKNIFLNFISSFIFTFVLTIGLLLALTSVHHLFDLDFNRGWYLRLFTFLSVFGSTLIFLLFTNKDLNHLSRDIHYPEILKFFSQFVLIPLLITYAIILYLYSLKILIHWDLPQGWVSYLVLAYSVVGILALLLVHPLKEIGSKSWVMVFSKLFYYTLLPLLILLFIAIFTRILKYGYTEPRYYVLMLAFWLSTVVLYFILIKKASIKFIPISLFIFAVLSFLLPYYNAFSVSKRSQKQELMKVLTDSKVLKDSIIDFNAPIQKEAADEIGDKVEFLIEREEAKFVFALLEPSKKQKLEKIISKDGNRSSAIEFRQYFTNEIKPKQDERSSFRKIYATDMVYPTEGYHYVTRFYDRRSPRPPLKLAINGDSIQFEDHLFDAEPKFIIKINDSAQKDLFPEIKKLVDKQIKTGEDLTPVDKLLIKSHFEKYQITIYFDDIIIENDSTRQYHFSNATILIK